MFFPETNRKIEKMFQNGILPTMVYIHKQQLSAQPMQRPLHRHESVCELLLVYKGTGIYMLEGKSYICPEGSIIAYNQGSLHETSAIPEFELGTYCIGLANVRKKGLPENHLLKPEDACIRSSQGLFPIIRSMFEQIYELTNIGESGSLAVQLLCASLLSLVDQTRPIQSAESLDTQKEHMLIRIQDYLNLHFSENITIATIADAIGCSETYVSRLFKKKTGQTPMQYVIRCRIGRAQTLLISTDLSVTEIATRVGYDNTNYFTTLFSRIVGMSPMQYRRQYKAEAKGLSHQL